MKKVIVAIMMAALLIPIYSQEIFRTNLEGLAVQSFAPNQAIDGFTVEGPSSEGYVHLVAHAGSESGQIARSRIQGVEFREFSFPEGECLTGFDASGPDEEGFVSLLALGSDGSSGSIFRTRWSGSAFKTFSSESPIIVLNATGPDEDGYVYLSVQTAGAGTEEPVQPEPLVYSLGTVNPGSGNVGISYSVAASCPVSLRIYDPTGRLITTLVDTEIPAGSHTLVWDRKDGNGREVNAGIYFMKMDAGEFSAVRKIVTVR